MAELATALSEAPQFDAAFRAAFAELLAWRRDVRHFRAGEAWTRRLWPNFSTSPRSRPRSAIASRPASCVSTTKSAAPLVRVNFEAANRQALGAYMGERAQLYAKLKLAGLRDAPIHLAVFCDEATEQGHGLGQRTMPETRRYSTVCALYTFWLAARARGVGVGWVSILDPVGVAEALDVPCAWTFIGYLCVGFPREDHLIPELERSGWQRRQPHPVIRR